jgi:LL-diaminopimelate aminotransferase
MQTADRIARVPLSPFTELAAEKARLRAAGVDVISLEVGSPDLPPPPDTMAEMARAGSDPTQYRYNNPTAQVALKVAFAAYANRLFGVELDPITDVLPLLGSNEGIAHLSQVLLNPGDVALIPDPAFPSYGPATALAGAEAYPLPLQPERGWLPDLSAIPGEIAARARVLWLNYPNNPTGAIASAAFFAEAVAYCRAHDIVLCHDNPYAESMFGHPTAASVLQTPGARDVAVELLSLSKSHNLAGLRVGALIGNPAVVDAVQRWKDQIDVGHALPIQRAAICALNTPPNWSQQRQHEYAARRDVVLSGLRALGFEVTPPVGGIYVWAGLPDRQNSLNWCRQALAHTGVALMPGIVFGAHSEGHIRVSLVAPVERLREAMHRLAALG